MWDSLHELRVLPYLEKQEKEDTDAVVCSRSKTTHRPHLQAALSDWNSQFTAALLAAGLSANEVNLDGETALHVAAHAGDAASCRLLLQAGADVWLSSASGRRALDLAIQAGHTSVIALLLEEEDKQKGTKTHRV